MADYQTYSVPRRAVGNPAVQIATKQGAYQPPTQASPTHYHSRTASSAIFTPSSPHPSSGAPQGFGMPYSQHTPQQQPQQYPPQSNRRLTNSTISSSESDRRAYSQQQQQLPLPPPPPQQQQALAPGQYMPPPSKTQTYNDGTLRRSTSSRSQASSLGPTSYVALLRKQKATVWCERTQPMDPRVQMQAKVARARAANEIMKTNGRASMSGNPPSVQSGGGMLSRNKNKQSKTQTSGGNAGANLAAGVGVPMRLSASEVGDEEEDDDVVYNGANGSHQRTGSGRSSLGGQSTGQGNRLAAPRTNTRLSYGSSNPGSIAGHTPPGTLKTMTSEVSALSGNAPLEHTNSLGSTGSEERREREMGDVGDMQAPAAVETQEKKFSKDELARRGSVDERSATMRGAAGAMRLFVANPDADDSD